MTLPHSNYVISTLKNECNLDVQCDGLHLIDFYNKINGSLLMLGRLDKIHKIHAHSQYHGLQ